MASVSVMLALLLVAVSAGLSNFAASIGIGTSGVDARTRLRVGLVFGVFEAGMPLVGLLIGDQLANQVGTAGRWAGAATLGAIGLYSIVSSLRRRRDHSPLPAGQLRLLLAGFALSLDNLVMGFALGTYHAPIVVSALVIGIVSVALSLLGLEIGARLAKWAGPRAELASGVILISVGAALASGGLS
jgi:manganese efflux pump family protein